MDKRNMLMRRFGHQPALFKGIIGIFLLVGILFLLRSSAAVPGIGLEAESGTVSGAATTQAEYVTLGGANSGSELPSPVKIMPLGDSITIGMHGTGADWNANKSLRGGYRAKLSESLTAWNASFDFVGGSEAIDVREQLGDKDHEGHGGWCLTGGGGTCYADGAANGNGGIDNYITNWLSQYNPDVILLHIGTNDMNGGDSAADLANRYGPFLDRIFAAKPNVYVFVSGLKLRDRDSAGFNAQLQNLINQRSAGGKKVYYVDTSAGGSADYWGADANGLHPSLNNYEVMGQNWFNAIQSALPGFPKKGGATPTPTATPTPSTGTEKPVGVPGNFAMTWRDEFNSSALNTNNWSFMTPWGGQFTQGEEFFTLDDYSVQNDLLSIFFRRRQTPIFVAPYNRTYNTVMLHTKGKVTVNSGQYIEFKLKPAKGNGFWSIAWIMPNSWPSDCGSAPMAQNYEMDVFEHLGRTPNQLTMTTHVRADWNCAQLDHDSKTYTGSDLTADFHTIGVNWFDTYTEIYLDGVKQFTSSKFAGHNEPGFILLNGFVGRAGDNWAGPPDASTPNEAAFLVDYVRVWNRN